MMLAFFLGPMQQLYISKYFFWCFQCNCLVSHLGCQLSFKNIVHNPWQWSQYCINVSNILANSLFCCFEANHFCRCEMQTVWGILLLTGNVLSLEMEIVLSFGVGCLNGVCVCIPWFTVYVRRMEHTKKAFECSYLPRMRYCCVEYYQLDKNTV